MKRTLPILTLLASQALALDSAVPSAFPANRYETMTGKSPFALATPPAPPPPPPQTSFAANWYLTGMGRDELGQDFITVKAQDGSVHFSLAGRDANPETGVALASVDWSDTMRKSTAIIRKGTETAKLIFSQEEAAPAPQQQGGRGGRPGGPGGPPPGVPLPPVTVPVTNAPTVGGGIGQPPQSGDGSRQPRIAVPRPGDTPVTVQPAAPPQPVAQPQAQPPQGTGSAPSGGGSYENRRRIRTIPAPR